MLALGKTGARTGSLNSCIDNLGVRLHINNVLCDYNCFADRTMLTLGKAGACTSSLNSYIDNLGVRYYRNYCLCYKNLSAFLTLRAIGKTGLGAGCVKAFDHLGFKVTTFRITDKSALIAGFIVFIIINMSNLCCCSLFNKNCPANRAFFTFGKTGFRAGSGLGRNCQLGMRRLGNHLLFDKSFITLGALFTCRKAGRGAGSINGWNCSFNVS